MRNFFNQLLSRWKCDKFVCVGLDSDTERLPQALLSTFHTPQAVYEFNRQIVDETIDLVCAYKLNWAFYLSFGPAGYQVLIDTIAYVHHVHQDVPVILDCKSADIGKTNEQYAQAFFDICMADAITIHPYLGQEAIEPFLAMKNKGVFILCRTSNKGAGEFQDMSYVYPGSRPPFKATPFYLNVARAVAEKWNHNANCGLVVGATYPKELKAIREVAPDMTLLIPGVGTQGGDLAEAVRNGMNKQGDGFIINSSSATIFNSSDMDFAKAARTHVLGLSRQVSEARQKN